MGVSTNAPVIIKRKKVISGGGHHGGAWKVAYADFVTAMMAFFMLMWLLNATTEQQRKGLADYFAPTVPLSRVSAGGDGMFGGTDIFSQDTMVQSGTGGAMRLAGSDSVMSPSQAKLEDLESALLGRGGEALLPDQILRHVVTRLTDEGLVIEFFDLPGYPLFIGETDKPRPTLRQALGMLAKASGIVENGIAVEGHTATKSTLLLENPVWDLSTSRASAVREILEADGVSAERLMRVTGHADRSISPESSEPMSIRNNRIEVIFLREDRR